MSIKRTLIFKVLFKIIYHILFAYISRIISIVVLNNSVLSVFKKSFICSIIFFKFFISLHKTVGMYIESIFLPFIFHSKVSLIILFFWAIVRLLKWVTALLRFFVILDSLYLNILPLNFCKFDFELFCDSLWICHFINISKSFQLKPVSFLKDFFVYLLIVHIFLLIFQVNHCLIQILNLIVNSSLY